MSQPAFKRMGVSDVRANMTEVIAEVRLLGVPVVLTRREKAQAVLVSVGEYEQVMQQRRLTELLKERDAALYEELLAQVTVEARNVVQRGFSDDVL
jgi:prevent-host-death family protein